MKVVVISNYAWSLVNIRGALLSSMVAAGHDVVACAPGENPAIRDRLLTLGVTYQPITLQRTGLNPFSDLRSLLSLVLLLRRLDADRIFSYTIKPVIYGSLAARLAGVRRDRVFSMVTGLGYAFTSKSRLQRLLSGPIRILYKAAIAHNSAVFFQNRDDRDLFIELGLVGSGTRALLMNGSGVDLGLFPAQPPVADNVSFLLIARLLRGKGIEEYAAAAMTLKKKYPDVRFRLIGPRDSNPESIPEHEVRQWTDAGAIEYGGPVDDVRPELSRASVFVLPSHREGTPRSVLEAMATGRPIVTTDAPGCRETVRHGQNGFLVPVEDSVALAQAMERFILDPGLIMDMGRASREIAVEKYDVVKINDHLLREMQLKRDAA